MIRVWGRANSTNVKKVLWVIEEAGQPCERVDVGGPFGGLDTPEFGRLNPNRKIPVVEDGGSVLWESNAIVRYLAARYLPGLVSQDPATRALADQWMDWASLAFAPALTPVFWTMVRTPADERDMAAVAAGIEACGRVLAVSEAALAGRPWLSGEAFGIGDIPLGVLVHGWFQMAIERPQTPNLEAWYARLCERPAYAKVVATPLS